MTRWLFLPNDVIGDLRVIGNLSSDQIKTLVKVLDSVPKDKGYKLYLRIAEALGLADETAASLYSFCDYVQRERDKANKSNHDVIAEIEYFLANRGTGLDAEVDDSNAEIAKSIAGKKEYLLALFGEMPNRVLATKTRQLSTGPLPHLYSLRTFCDVRPIFDSKGDKIQAIVPMVTLSIVTHGGFEDQKQSLIHLSQSDISMIRKEFGRLNRKLKALKLKFPELSPTKNKAND